ncbi:hypothetical protein, partial [Vibrio cholerae]|uniref:hypothetical protein n=1 Tax=Vibrio cholerae TaxID=666 RepID=UPI001E43052F
LFVKQRKIDDKKSRCGGIFLYLIFISINSPKMVFFLIHKINPNRFMAKLICSKIKQFMNLF